MNVRSRIKKGMSLLIAITLLVAVHSTGASAAPLIVSSYNMPNGDTGQYTYLDNTYVGTSPAINSSTAGAALYGGTGKLTDGVVATLNWNVTPQYYVGWMDYNPTITFNFAKPVTINSVTFAFDDSMDSGGTDVTPPGSVVIGGNTYAVTVQTPLTTATYAPFLFTVGGLNLLGSSTAITINRGQGNWFMLSEVTFSGAVPESPIFLTVLGGLLTMLFSRGSIHHRRKA